MLSRVILLVLLSLLGADAVCSNNAYTESSGQCYRLVATAATYAEGEAACAADGGHLVSILSEPENTYLAGIVTDVISPIIGVQCTASNVNTCTWGDGSAFGYQHFATGAPITDYGNCAILKRSGTWQSADCNTRASSYLCKMPTAGGAVCSGAYSAYGNKCIVVKGTPMTADDAENDCAIDGGHLVSIHSDTDNANVQARITAAGVAGDVHIGLVLNKQAGRYVWRDGTAYDYTKFATNFPNVRFGECVQFLMTTEFGAIGQWANYPCPYVLPYVCERAQGPGPTFAPPTCSGTQFYDDQGTVYSPSFPNTFAANTRCEYFLSVQPGGRISIKVPKFQTDAGSSLTIYDGIDNSNVLQTLSGTPGVLAPIVSTQNLVKLVFVGSAAPTGTGWEIQFSTTGLTTTTSSLTSTTTTSAPIVSGGCPATNYYPNATLSSPGYPGNYYNLLSCTYTIQSLTFQHVQIVFGEIRTEQCCDIITLYDGSNTNIQPMATLSGVIASGLSYKSSGSILTLVFATDSLNAMQGWTAQVYNVN